VFQKFAQADASDTRQKGGTGLGLSISKVLVESHQGTIGFDTTTDVGTTFYFGIPLAQSSTDRVSIHTLHRDDEPQTSHRHREAHT
jgi:signal transduction histidine kinase